MTDERPGEAVTEATTLAAFLEGVPPNQAVLVEYLNIYVSTGPNPMNTPQLQLHCGSNTCNGLRFFRYTGDRIHLVGKPRNLFLSYLCSNCRETQKLFSIHATPAADNESDVSGTVFKFGESPVYGPPTPARMIRMFGKEREIFLKGRRCENQGLGIGAFVYYRRVVENQKDYFLDEIIKVAQKIGAPAATIETLVAAKSEIQFFEGCYISQGCHSASAAG